MNYLKLVFKKKISKWLEFFNLWLFISSFTISYSETEFLPLPLSKFALFLDYS